MTLSFGRIVSLSENEAKQKTYFTRAHDQEKLDNGDYFVSAIVVKRSGAKLTLGPRCHGNSLWHRNPEIFYYKRFLRKTLSLSTQDIKFQQLATTVKQQNCN